ncbi:MAG: tRNA (adenosine(37)-N6)-dimethylallyltransferase MiaA [Clostridiales bacterium]|nr:tRNA (adenosine(37)-N6)-dimethylallyltransferase MiaA [Clostridiales bacterium]
MKEKNRTVYIISGPTAVGKSLIAFYLAKRIGGEIVNCDSVQLYKYMDIGSAKPSEREMSVIRHHLYSIVDPDYNMTAATYQKLAKAVIDDILARGRVPIVCGGTGLYLNSILYDMSFAGSKGDAARREELEKMAETNGSEYMHQFLNAIDPESASRIHPHNTRKIIRAIEAYEQGNGIKDLSECPLNPDYDFRFFALTMDRNWLYERINRRVDKLISAGLVEEVQHLLDMGYTLESSAMKGIGYKEIINSINGMYDIYDAVDEIKKNTRHYAKRQLTWLRRYDFVNWLEITKGETVGALVDRILSFQNEGKTIFEL